MTFSTKTAQIWMAMGIGPLYIERDAEDPLSPQAILAEPVPQPPKNNAGEQVRSRVETSRRYEAPVTSRLSGIGPDVGVASAPVSLPSQVEINRSTRENVPQNTPRTVSVSERSVSVGYVNSIPSVAPACQTISFEAMAGADWAALREMAAQCRACPGLASRLANVFGCGGPDRPIVIVGEAPGRDEDIQGVPFVGKSGQLLNNILKEVGIDRDREVAIINVLKCRPPENRNPREDEVQACSGFLTRQLQLINPSVIIILGRFAAQSLLKTTQSLSHLREKEHMVDIAGRSVPAFVSYHPSYLLRSPKQKIVAWRDFSRIQERYAQLKA